MRLAVYVVVLPLHTVERPEMDAGAAGADKTVTEKDVVPLEPQLLEAATVIIPPAVPAVAAIAEVLLLPVHVAGSVHEYVVAPATLLQV